MVETTHSTKPAEVGSMVRAFFDKPERVRYKFRELIPPLKAAIENCEHRANQRVFGYRGAIRLCSKGRDLMMWYVNEWQSNHALEVYATEIGALFKDALAMLELVKASSFATASEKAHVEKMMVNTNMRISITDVLASGDAPESKYEQVMVLYRTVKSDRGLDISGL